jgi:hypothetical protein
MAHAFQTLAYRPDSIAVLVGRVIPTQGPPTATLPSDRLT